MKARWVSERPEPKLPIVGQAIVATWWPSKYYVVSTIQMDSSCPEARLLQSLKTGTPYEDVQPGPDVFIAQVFRCNRHGWVRQSFLENPLYEKEYPGLSEAKIGHKQTVALLAEGKLDLSLRAYLRSFFRYRSVLQDLLYPRE